MSCFPSLLGPCIGLAMLLAVGLTSPVAAVAPSVNGHSRDEESSSLVVDVDDSADVALLTPSTDVPRPERQRDHAVPALPWFDAADVACIAIESDRRRVPATPAAIRSLPLRR